MHMDTLPVVYKIPQNSETAPSDAHCFLFVLCPPQLHISHHTYGVNQYPLAVDLHTESADISVYRLLEEPFRIPLSHSLW